MKFYQSVRRDLLVNLHNNLVFDAGYLHALSKDQNQDEEIRHWALRTSRRNMWLATELALECALPTVKIDSDSLWATSPTMRKPLPS
jgi:hypothetical protein